MSIPRRMWHFHVTCDVLEDGSSHLRLESESGRHVYEKVGRYPVLMLLRMFADHAENVAREPVKLRADTCCNGEPE